MRIQNVPIDSLTADAVQQNVREMYNTIAREWDISRNHARDSFMLLKNKIRPHASLLDLGCGNGRLYPYLHEHFEVAFTGIDSSEELIRIAKSKYPEATFLVGDALSLPFPDSSFDYVLSFAVLHHIAGAENHRRFLSEIARVLKPGGKSLITLWNMYQSKYRRHLLHNLWGKLKLKWKNPHNSSIGFKDVFVPFGPKKIPRYVHAFTERELKTLVPESLSIDSVFFSTKGEIVPTRKEGYNLCMWVQKKS